MIFTEEAFAAARRQPVAGVGAQSALHDDEPVGAVVPGGHAAQDGEPAAFANVFAGHSVHVLEPAVPANDPAGHGAQGSMPPGPNEPAGHAASVVVVTPTHIDDPGSDVVPSGHGRQDDWPVMSVNVSAGQTEHTLDPPVAAKLPAGHGVHGSAPPGPKLPAGHGEGVHAVLPGGDVVPLGQALHRNAPDVLENVSVGHCEQMLEPGVGANDPAGHGVHGSIPPGPNDPAGHVASVVVVTGVQLDDPGSDVVPPGHASHVGEPGMEAKVSAGHGEHELAPASLKKPGEHGSHGSMPPGPKEPAGQVCAAAGQAASAQKDIARTIDRMTALRTGAAHAVSTNFLALTSVRRFA